MGVKVLNNVTDIVCDDMMATIRKGSKLFIAAACFSMYAYEELKEQLESVEECRFLFTSPTFVQEKAEKQKREFYIPRLNRERSLYGTEFEIKLRNEMTQKAIAKECANWIREKVTFKSNISGETMQGFATVADSGEEVAYMPLDAFTTVDIGCERGNNSYYMVNRLASPLAKAYIDLFNAQWNDADKLQDVTEEVIESISTVYNENAPEFIYFMTLYHIFSEFLEDISEDELPNEATGFRDSKIWNMLFNFQEDAAISIINKLEKYNGCILADSVGLGKTFTALAVIKYYEKRNKSVLVLCPKKLANNWNTYKANYVNNPLAEDRLRYDVLFHTDLNRERGQSNGLDLDRFNWGNYDLVVIDESHNFRNGGKISGDDQKENRYLRLLNKVIRTGVKTKVLMLSATPVNNKFLDLKNQLALAYEGQSERLDQKLKTKRSVDEIFRQAQSAYKSWASLSAPYRTTENLLKMLDNAFFELLDSVTIARSRKHIQRFYDTRDIGTFPERRKPISMSPGLTDLDSAITYSEIFDLLNDLGLSIYTPTQYILNSKIRKYAEKYDGIGDMRGLSQFGREQGIRRIMAINLMKRLESSVHSFRLTLNRINAQISNAIELIEDFKATRKNKDIKLDDFSNIDFDGEDQEDDLFVIGRKVQIDIADMDYETWGRELRADKSTLDLLISMVSDITPQYDKKLETLFEVIDHKQNHPINSGNKKILIFTAFADTAEYLYESINPYIFDKYGLHTALVTGTSAGKTSLQKSQMDLNDVLTLFSPLSKDKNLLMPGNTDEIDILIATDCISEGQNLQDCDCLINYDIHWNPVRIIQRFGRIDRIGSQNAFVQLINFWPDITLDEYIKLKGRVEARMKIVDLAATGDDNLLSPEESLELEYRKKQLMKLQEEVVDIEEMNEGISIMDLGLNEFRLDLLHYVKENPHLEKAPKGLHAIVKGTEDLPPGVLFVLKNYKNSVNVENQNRLHPFYMVYLSFEGDVIMNHLAPKQILDSFRFLCKGKKEADLRLCDLFNQETKDGKDMSLYSGLLGDAIQSIIDVKDENDIDDFLSGRQISFFSDSIDGLDDFELISFLIIRERE